jgi:exodeoxyribonuclease-3
VPNSKRELTRLAYRQQWDRDFLRYLKKLEQKKPVIFCGDLNVAHTEIDLANPQANIHNHGFTPEERAGFTAFVRAGFLDTFREFEKGGGHYTWWSPMSGARSRNVGWRIDYFLIKIRCVRVSNAPSSNLTLWAAITVPSASSLNSRGAR